MNCSGKDMWGNFMNRGIFKPVHAKKRRKSKKSRGRKLEEKNFFNSTPYSEMSGINALSSVSQKYVEGSLDIDQCFSSSFSSLSPDLHSSNFSANLEQQSDARKEKLKRKHSKESIRLSLEQPSDAIECDVPSRECVKTKQKEKSRNKTNGDEESSRTFNDSYVQFISEGNNAYKRKFISTEKDESSEINSSYQQMKKKKRETDVLINQTAIDCENSFGVSSSVVDDPGISNPLKYKNETEKVSNVDAASSSSKRKKKKKKRKYQECLKKVPSEHGENMNAIETSNTELLCSPGSSVSLRNSLPKSKEESLIERETESIHSTPITKKKRKRKKKTRQNDNKETDDTSQEDVNGLSLINSTPDNESNFNMSSNDDSMLKSFNGDIFESEDSYTPRTLRNKSFYGINENRTTPQSCDATVNGIDYDILLNEVLLDNRTKTAKETLQGIQIVMEHEIPHLHLVDIRPCCLPRKEEKERLTAMGMKGGSFNKSEDTILMSNWEKFSKDHGITDPTIFLDMRRNRGSEVKREFLQFLGIGLQDRALYQIYQRFSLLCHPRKGLFSKEEDRVILKVMEMNVNQPYNILCRVLRRSRQSVYKRYQMLTAMKIDETGETQVKQKWNIELAEAVVKSLIDMAKSSSINEFKNVSIPVNKWRQIGLKLGIPHWKLRQFWGYKLHTQLFAESPICESDVCKKIIKWLRRENPTTEKEISWVRSTHLVSGSTPWFMWAMFRRLRKTYGAHVFKSLREFVQAMYKGRPVFDTENRYLVRYRVNEDKSLEVIVDK